MQALGRIYITGATLALAAALTFSVAHAVQPTGGPVVSSSLERVAEKAAKAKAQTASEKPAPKKVAEGTGAAKPKASRPRPGGCGTGKYYDRKTKTCADASAKQS
jgi:hypothetical protein